MTASRTFAAFTSSPWSALVVGPNSPMTTGMIPSRLWMSCADRTPVVGFDPAAEGFFWLVGQGGYGIQSAEGLGRLAAALACDEGVPADLAAEGVSADSLARSRF